VIIILGILDRQIVLDGRFILPKGYSSVRMLDLKERISKLWKTNGLWSMVSLGKGCFEFDFSLDDLSAVRSIRAWNVSSGFLQTFAWTTDFNPHKVQQTIAQHMDSPSSSCSRILVKKKTLFEIVGDWLLMRQQENFQSMCQISNRG